jgi:hypothetical protein
LAFRLSKNLDTKVDELFIFEEKNNWEYWIWREKYENRKEG